MIHAAATADAEAAARGQRFSGRPLPRARHLLAVTARAVCAAAEQTGVPALARMPRAARSGWHVDLGTDAVAWSRPAGCSPSGKDQAG